MTTTTQPASSYDAVVVGGGPAGLAGAVALARFRRRVLVVDAGEPRNKPAAHLHNYLGREGMPPAELLATGRRELAGYGGELVAATAVAARRVEGSAPGAQLRFAVELDDGTVVEARRLLVATGLVDELPDLPGVAERWGRDVLHCPYCHGYEVRDQAVGVLATGAMAVHQAQLFRQLTADVTLFRHTGPGPSEEERDGLAARGIAVVDGEVVGLEVTDDRLTGVRLAGGRVVPRDAVVVAPRFVSRSTVLESLGVDAVEQEQGGVSLGAVVPADPTGATGVSGVWVAGNVSDLRAQVISATAEGLAAGAMLNADLIAEDTRVAVAAR